MEPGPVDCEDVDAKAVDFETAELVFLGESPRSIMTGEEDFRRKKKTAEDEKVEHPKCIKDEGNRNNAPPFFRKS